MDTCLRSRTRAADLDPSSIERRAAALLRSGRREDARLALLDAQLDPAGAEEPELADAQGRALDELTAGHVSVEVARVRRCALRRPLGWVRPLASHWTWQPGEGPCDLPALALRVDLLDPEGLQVAPCAATLARIAAFPGLASLDLGAPLGPTASSALQGSAGLRELTCAAPVDAAALRALAPCELASLELRNLPDPADDTCAALGELSSLERLVLSRHSPWLTDAGVERLASLPRLRDLSLPRSPWVTGSGLAPLLDHATTVRRLVLGGPRLGLPALAVAAELPLLEVLDLEGSGPLCDEALDWLTHCQRLRLLRLRGHAELTGRQLRRLEELEHLEYLDLVDVPGLDDDALEALAGLPSLKSLWLASGRRHWGERGLRALAHGRALRELCLGDESSRAELRAVGDLPALERLALRGDLQSEALDPLPGAAPLTWVDAPAPVQALRALRSRLRPGAEVWRLGRPIDAP